MTFDTAPGYEMRNLLKAFRDSLLPILLGALCTFGGAGCGHLQSGPTFYEPVAQKDGSVKMSPVLAVDADVEGERIEIKTPSTSFVVTSPAGVFSEKVILNKKGDTVLGTERVPALARIGTSGVVTAKGQAAREVIGATSTGIAAGISAAALGPVTGGAVGLGK